MVFGGIGHQLEQFIGLMMNQEMPQSKTARKGAPRSLSGPAKIVLAASVIVSAGVVAVFAPKDARDDSPPQPPVKIFADSGDMTLFEAISIPVLNSEGENGMNAKSSADGIPGMVAAKTEEEYLAMFHPSEIKPIQGPNLIVMNTADESSSNSKTTAKEPEERQISAGGSIDEELARVLARFPKNRKNNLDRWNAELERPEKIVLSKPAVSYSDSGELVPLVRANTREQEILVPISTRRSVVVRQD